MTNIKGTHHCAYNCVCVSDRERGEKERKERREKEIKRRDRKREKEGDLGACT